MQSKKVSARRNRSDNHISLRKLLYHFPDENMTSHILSYYINGYLNHRLREDWWSYR